MLGVGLEEEGRTPAKHIWSLMGVLSQVRRTEERVFAHILIFHFQICSRLSIIPLNELINEFVIYIP